MPDLPPLSARLDYFGVGVPCGCISAWMSSRHCTPAEIEQFHAEMAATGRVVKRMELTEDLRSRIVRCPHKAEQAQQTQAAEAEVVLEHALRALVRDTRPGHTILELQAGTAFDPPSELDLAAAELLERIEAEETDRG
jgi:hypothetical protein